MTPSIRLKIVAFRPTPKPRHRMATVANPLLRARLRSVSEILEEHGVRREARGQVAAAARLSSVRRRWETLDLPFLRTIVCNSSVRFRCRRVCSARRHCEPSSSGRRLARTPDQSAPTRSSGRRRRRSGAFPARARRNESGARKSSPDIRTSSTWGRCFTAASNRSHPAGVEIM